MQVLPIALFRLLVVHVGEKDKIFKGYMVIILYFLRLESN